MAAAGTFPPSTINTCQQCTCGIIITANQIPTKFNSVHVHMNILPGTFMYNIKICYNIYIFHETTFFFVVLIIEISDFKTITVKWP